MNNSFFTNENQLDDWIEAALNIKERFGIEKALGYLIGEKYHGLLRSRYAAKQLIQTIENQRKGPDYNPIRESDVPGIEPMNLDELCDRQKSRLAMLDNILIEFAHSIKGSFDQGEINIFLRSTPRFGALGHVCSEDEHRFFIEKGAVEQSLDTEVEDALIFGEMERIFAP